MNVEVNPKSAVAIVSGTTAEITRLEDILVAWAGQTRGGGMPVWLRRGARRLDALLGSLLSLGILGPDVHAEERSEIARLRLGIAPLNAYLRPYQRAAVQAAVGAPHRRCILSLPMGSGKTRIACALARVVGGSWLYLVANQQLADQTRKEAPSNMSCYSFGTAPDSALAEAEGLIVDEVHRVAARTYARRVMKCNAAYRVGLSGTPLLRCDARNSLTLGLFGPVVYQITVQELESLGFLSRGAFVSV